MKHLSELRKQLIDAEIAYKNADSSLDCSPLEVIICREELKNARFVYSQACREFVEETLFCDGA